MLILIIGLTLFLGIHSTRIFADPWRTKFIAQRGDKAWKGVYTLVSLVGFGLIVWGFGLARQQPVLLWSPPTGLKHLNALLTWLAFVLLAATNNNKSQIHGVIHHPMVLGVKVWALGHLLANGMVHDVILFGSFLVWSILCFAASRRRDRVTGIKYAKGSAIGTAINVLIGTVLWAIFAFWLHGWLIGIKAFSI